MEKIEDYCVGCPPEMGCLGNSCPNKNVLVHYCDECDDYASYEIDGNDYCDACAKEYLQEVFDDLSISEKAETLEISFKEYE